jgi:hypothetical protein
VRPVTPAPRQDGEARSDAVRDDDPFLLVRARGGDRAAFTQVANRHREAAEAFAALLNRLEAAAAMVSRAVDRLEAELPESDDPFGPFRPRLLEEIRVLRQGIGGELGGAKVGSSSQWSAFADVYRALPVDLQALLWHAVVEDDEPDQVALAVGIEADEVEDAVARCRSRLRDDFLQDHLDRAASAGCRRTMVAEVSSGTLGVPSPEHRATCADCRKLVRDLAMVEHQLDWVVAAVVLGAHALLYLRTRKPEEAAPAADPPKSAVVIPEPAPEPDGSPAPADARSAPVVPEPRRSVRSTAALPELGPPTVNVLTRNSPPRSAAWCDSYRCRPRTAGEPIGTSGTSCAWSHRAPHACLPTTARAVIGMTARIAANACVRVSWF